MTAGEEFITTVLLLGLFYGIMRWLSWLRDNRIERVAMVLANGRLHQENAALLHRLELLREALFEAHRQMKRSNPGGTGAA